MCTTLRKKRYNITQQGQILTWWALLLPLAVLLLWAALFYAIGSVRVMATAAAADLAAHAAAQQVAWDVYGRSHPLGDAAAVGARVFERNAPEGAQLHRITCVSLAPSGVRCVVEASVRLPMATPFGGVEVPIRAVGFLATGATREHQ